MRPKRWQSIQWANIQLRSRLFSHCSECCVWTTIAGTISPMQGKHEAATHLCLLSICLFNVEAVAWSVSLALSIVVGHFRWIIVAISVPHFISHYELMWPCQPSGVPEKYIICFHIRARLNITLIWRRKKFKINVQPKPTNFWLRYLLLPCREALGESIQ